MKLKSTNLNKKQQFNSCEIFLFIAVTSMKFKLKMLNMNSLENDAYLATANNNRMCFYAIYYDMPWISFSLFHFQSKTNVKIK